MSNYTFRSAFNLLVQFHALPASLRCVDGLCRRRRLLQLNSTLKNGRRRKALVNVNANVNLYSA